MRLHGVENCVILMFDIVRSCFEDKFRPKVCQWENWTAFVMIQRLDISILCAANHLCTSLRETIDMHVFAGSFTKTQLPSRFFGRRGLSVMPQPGKIFVESFHSGKKQSHKSSHSHPLQPNVASRDTPRCLVEVCGKTWTMSLENGHFVVKIMLFLSEKCIPLVWVECLHVVMELLSKSPWSLSSSISVRWMKRRIWRVLDHHS